jgi:hypothetical protein
MVKFPFEFIYHFEDVYRRSVPIFAKGNDNFRENENFSETKFREHVPIFAFRQNGKNRFHFNPSMVSF